MSVILFDLSFIDLFAGIMAGANMSGELKNPNKAIPRGTVQATSFTLFCYTLLAFLVAFTCDNFLLKNNYNFLQAIDLHFSIVLIGTFVTTLRYSRSAWLAFSGFG